MRNQYIAALIALMMLSVGACDDGGSAPPAAQVVVADATLADGSSDDAALPDAALEDGALDDAALPDAAVPDAALPLAEEVIAADPPVYSGDACPDFMNGPNSFAAGAKMRDFNLFLPPEPEGAPVLLIWHPLGSNAGQIGRFYDAANIAANQGWIVVVPESLRTQTEWGYFGGATDDLALFDDLLACLDVQFGFDTQRLYTTGFSAGALWSSYLIMHRAQHLNAALVYSGGVTNFAPFRVPDFAMPVLMTWGGPNDQFGGVINFQESTYLFRDRLRENGHPVVTCEHAGGHVPPPQGAGWGIEYLAGHTTRVAAPAFADDAPYPDSCTVIP
ncbi:MAG: poly(3-hydroxybutyrate) depolymerase [Bradymonadia bacterium]|jgi:poly(3-hydroxybutyrate) depolymerase